MLAWSFAERRPDLLVWVTDGHDPVYLGSDDGRFIKATASLSTPMTVLSRGAKGNGRCIFADGRFIKASGRFIKRREKLRQGQWPFYQGQWPFYQGAQL